MSIANSYLQKLNNIANSYLQKLNNVDVVQKNDFFVYILFKNGTCTDISDSFIANKDRVDIWEYCNRMYNNDGTGYVIKKLFDENSYQDAITDRDCEIKRIKTYFKFDLFRKHDINSNTRNYNKRAEELFLVCSKENDYDFETIEKLFDTFVQFIKE
jgi:hypothetical protein